MKLVIVLATTATTALTVSAQAQTFGRAVSGDGDLNLTSYINAFDTAGGGTAFSSLADGFQIYERGVSPSIPFNLADDSAGSFGGDVIGIVKTADTDPFFGVSDTDNGDTSGPVSAQFVFDVSSATTDLFISADIAAMGDFESVDSFVISYAFGSDALTPLFTAVFFDTGEEEGTASGPGAMDGTPTGNPALLYTLDSGTEVSLNDPLAIDGVLLTNEFATFSSSLLTPTAGTLTIDITVDTDGGEGFAFRNLTIAIPEPGSFLLFGAGLGLLTTRRKRYA